MGKHADNRWHWPDIIWFNRIEQQQRGYFGRGNIKRQILIQPSISGMHYLEL
jgi:hypothetical protein